VPLGEARIGRIGLDEWLRRSQAAEAQTYVNRIFPVPQSIAAYVS
jgi:hypothetical protein